MLLEFLISKIHFWWEPKNKTKMGQMDSKEFLNGLFKVNIRLAKCVLTFWETSVEFYCNYNS